jgi:hypothetical protein
VPITLQQLSGLITHAPPQMYQGGAGSGLRQGLQMMAAQRQQKLENEMAQQKVAAQQAQQRQELEGKAIGQFQAAALSGDDTAVEMAAQNLSRLGYNVQRPDVAPAEGAPDGGAQAGSESDDTSDRAIDDFFAKKAGKKTAPAPRESAPGSPALNPLTAFRPGQQEDFESKLVAGEELGGPGPKQANKSWRITSADGRELANIDAAKIRATRAENVAGMFQPLIAQARDEVERTAATKAAHAAIAATNTMDTNAAIEEGLKLYKFEVGPRRARYGWGGAAAGGPGGPAAPSLSKQRFDFTQSKALNDRYDDIIERTARGIGLNTEVMKADSALRAVEAALGANNGTGDLASVTKALKAMGNTGAMSDKDLERIMNSSGVWNNFKNVVGRAESGQLPPELMRNVGDMAKRLRGALDSTKQAAGEAARNKIYSDPGPNGLGRLKDIDPETLEQMAESAVAEFVGGRASWATGSKKPAGKPAAAPAGNEDDETEDEKEAQRLR